MVTVTLPPPPHCWLPPRGWWGVPPTVSANINKFMTLSRANKQTETKDDGREVISLFFLSFFFGTANVENFDFVCQSEPPFWPHTPGTATPASGLNTLNDFIAFFYRCSIYLPGRVSFIFFVVSLLFFCHYYFTRIALGLTDLCGKGPPLPGLCPLLRNLSSFIASCRLSPKWCLNSIKSPDQWLRNSGNLFCHVSATCPKHTP